MSDIKISENFSKNLKHAKAKFCLNKFLKINYTPNDFSWKPPVMATHHHIPLTPF